MKTITKELAIQTYQSAPQLIKNAVDSGQTVSIIVEIGKKHNLHIDVFGKLAQLNSYLLLGLATPQNLMQELIAAKILEKDAREIMNEINQKIFVPLREEMRSAGGGSASGGKVENAQPIKSAPLPVQKPTPTPIPPPIPKPISIPAPKVVPVPAQTFAPGQKYSPPSHFHLQNKIPPLQSFPAPSTQPPASRLLEEIGRASCRERV